MAQNNKTFRVFVSSTFSDFKVERDALQSVVFPKLRDLCRQNGCRFQAIDLRWGVSEESARDQRTMKICLEEIKRCQRITPRPNFIVLLGDRYGWRPLPYEIPAKEFEAIIRVLLNPTELDLLGHWYRRDDNAVPATYCLQPLESDLKTRSATEVQLRRILLTAIEQLPFDETQRFKYEASATEQEIEAGALAVEDANEHVFAFFRHFDRLPLDMSAVDFVDFDAQRSIDQIARERLTKLKGRLARKLSVGGPGDDNSGGLRDSSKAKGDEAPHVFTYETHWTGYGISTDHLDLLTKNVYDGLATAILTQIAKQETVTPLRQEILAHEDFGKERADNFVGRTAYLERISDYLAQATEHPLAIFGDSGCGKSALLARAAADATERYAGAVIIQRYVGVTPTSSDGRALLESLCKEIASQYGDDEPRIPATYQDLAKAVPQQLERATAEKPLIIFLDALDQLSDNDHARNLVWLPTELLPNAHIVVTVLPDKCLTQLRRKLPASSLLQMEPMTSVEGDEALELWLRGARRGLRPEQRDVVLRGFQAKGLPLYLKLAFEEARRWMSSTEPRAFPTEMPAMIRLLFERLAQDHGPMLIKRALGYLAAARHGLSEDELLDVLSLDREVFDDFVNRARQPPPEHRLPVVVWSRIYFDLEPYLTERSAHGTSLLVFYHRQLGEVVNREFPGGSASRACHRSLAQYFQAQPLYSETAPNVRKLSELAFHQTAGELWDTLGHTLGNLQFVEAKCDAGMVTNLADDYEFALAKLPDAEPRRHEEEREREELDRYRNELVKYCRPWNASLLSASADERDSHFTNNIRDIFPAAPLASFHEQSGTPSTSSESSHGEAGSIGERIREYKTFVATHAHIIAQHPKDVVTIARNHAANGVVVKQAESLVANLQQRWVSRDPRPPLADAGGSGCLRTLIGHTKRVAGVSISLDGSLAVSASDDGTLCVWNLASGECLHALTEHGSPVRAVAVCANGKTAVSGGNAKFREEGTWLANFNPRRLDTVSGKRYFLQSEPWTGLLRAWDLDTERTMIFRGPPDKPPCIEVWCVALTPDGSLAVSGGRNARDDNRADFTIYVWDVTEGRCIRALEGHTHLVSSVSITPDAKTIVSASYDGTVRVWDTKSGLCKGVFTSPIGFFGTPSIVYSAAVTANGQKIVSVGHEEADMLQRMRVWDVRADHSETIPGASAGGINYRTVAMDPQGKFALTDSERDTLSVWNLESGQLVNELEAGHSGQINSIALLPNARLAVSGSEDHTLRVWRLGGQVKSRFFARHISEVNDVEISADRRMVVSAGDDSFAILWNRATGAISGHQDKGKVRTLQIAPDCQTVVSWGGGRLLTWDLQTGKVHQEIKIESAGGLDFITTPDGKILITRDVNRSDVQVWDLNSARLLRVFDRHFSHVRCAITSPDASKVISGGLDDQVCVFDLQSGHLLQSYLDHLREVSSLAITPDGKIVVSAGIDKTIRVWSLDSGETFHVLEGHTDKIRFVTITADGRKIVSSSDDNTVRLWDIKSGRLMQTYEHLAGATQIAFAADGKTALTEGLDDRLLIWDLMSGQNRAAYHPNAQVKAFSGIQVDNFFVCGTKDGQVHFLKVNHLVQDPPIATATRLFRIDAVDQAKVSQTNETPIFGEDDVLPGHYESDPTSVCAWCGARFVPEALVLDTISSLTSALLPNQPPCITVAEEAWDDERLVSPCPNCRRPIKFNPFIAEASPALSEERRRPGPTSKAVHQIDYYDGKVRRDPNNLKAHQELGNYFGSHEDWDNAIALFRHALTLDPKDVAFYTNFAVALMQRDGVTEAIELAQRAVAIAQENLKETTDLSDAIRTRFELDQPTTAEPPITNEHTQYLSRALLVLGMAYESAGENVNAVAAYEQAIQADATVSVNPFIALGNLFGKNDKWDEALDAYEQVLKIDPVSLNALSNTAYVLQEKGEHDRALGYLAKAAEVSPTDPLTWFDLGAAYKDKGEFPRALEFFRKSVTLDPNSYKSNLSLALIYEDMRDWKNSVYYYQKALLLTDEQNLKDEIEPKIVEIKNKLGAL